MTIRKMPEAKALQRPQSYQWDVPSDVLAKWNERPQAAESDDPNTISIYDVIGFDPWTGGGFTLKRAAAALRAIGPNPVTVKINSPGGDLFEGLAIYNLFREHPAKVTIDVLGWSASAASIIQMAGDEIRMGLGTFTMVHNAWGVVVGNRHDFISAAELFEGFDSAIVDIYEARTGQSRAQIQKLMDAETFLGPTEAVKYGFADSVADDLTTEDSKSKPADRRLMARRQMENALAKQGISRNMRSEMISMLMGEDAATRDAGRKPTERDAGQHAATRDAGEFESSVRELITAIKK